MEKPEGDFEVGKQEVDLQMEKQDGVLKVCGESKMNI